MHVVVVAVAVVGIVVFVVVAVAIVVVIVVLFVVIVAATNTIIICSSISIHSSSGSNDDHVNAGAGLLEGKRRPRSKTSTITRQHPQHGSNHHNTKLLQDSVTRKKRRTTFTGASVTSRQDSNRHKAATADRFASLQDRIVATHSQPILPTTICVASVIARALGSNVLWSVACVCCFVLLVAVVLL